MRHGESENNVLDILSSSLDNTYHLTEKGRRQVLEKGTLLKKTERIEFIISSPVARTVETAKIIAECLDIPTTLIRIDSRLKEPYFGKAEGKTYKEYLALRSNQKDLYNLEGVNGEAPSSISERIDDLLKEVIASEKFIGKTVLFVTHSFAICQILKIFGKDRNELPKQAEYYILEIN